MNLPGGPINDPSSKIHHYLPFLQHLPRLRLGPLRVFFELMWRPSRALASCVASETPENQGHCQVCHARRGGPRISSTSAQTMIACVLRMHLVFVASKIKKPGPSGPSGPPLLISNLHPFLDFHGITVIWGEVVRQHLSENRVACELINQNANIVDPSYSFIPVAVA